MAELKPCPFCGEIPELIMIDLTSTEAMRFTVMWVVNCNSCHTKKHSLAIYRFTGGETVDVLQDGKSNVIELWNRRAKDGK